MEREGPVGGWRLEGEVGLGGRLARVFEGELRVGQEDWGLCCAWVLVMDAGRVGAPGWGGA